MINVGSVIKTELKSKDGKNINLKAEIISDHGDTYKIRVISPSTSIGNEMFLLKNRKFEVAVAEI
jgi:hypothetical protein